MVNRVEKIDLVCQHCKTHFKKYKCQILSEGSGKFCSKKCMDDSRRTGSNMVCELCDTVFYRALAEQDIGEKVNNFCSISCYKEHRRVNAKSSTYLKIGAIHAHRITAESILGRSLVFGEVVHHKDFNKKNNSPENLYVFPSQSIHCRCHFGEMSAKELEEYSVIKLANAQT